MAQDAARLQGLSPRLRGNLIGTWRKGSRLGSIPAPAGEPLHPSYTTSRRPVYPRACGGTLQEQRRIAEAQGLSPRLRGNLCLLLIRNRLDGSIPAPAGEPRQGTRGTALPWVYPRACGGTVLSSATTSRLSGLSPRLRGNPVKAALKEGEDGSIPAPAGEPLCETLLLARKLVYPRACGGTSAG